MKLKKWLGLTKTDENDDINFESMFPLGLVSIEEAVNTSINDDEDAETEINFAHVVINSILEDLKRNIPIFGDVDFEDDFSHAEEQIGTLKALPDTEIINTIKQETPPILFSRNEKPFGLTGFSGHELNSSDVKNPSELSTEEKFVKDFIEDTKVHVSNVVQTRNVAQNNRQRLVQLNGDQENNLVLKKSAVKTDENVTPKLVIKKLSNTWVSKFLIDGALKKDEEKSNSKPCNPIKQKRKKNFSFSCQNCGSLFRTKNYQKIYTQMKGSELQYPTSPSTTPSMTDGNSLAQRKEGFHTADRSYECTICQKSFNTRCGLRRHGIHHKERERTYYECSSCENSFSTKYHLWRHELIHHTGNRPYDCNLCKKSFASKGNLRRHQEIHAADHDPR